MQSYSLLADHAVDAALASAVFVDRSTTATLLQLLGESDARRRYLALGHPSMFQYCVSCFHMSEGTAYKRISVARVARRFPSVLNAIAAGQLNLSAVVMLAPHLSIENAGELLATATHKTRSELELLLVSRAPKRDLPTRIVPVFQSELSPGTVGMTNAPHVAQPVPAPEPRANVAPLSPTRYALQITVDAGTHAKLKRAQELLGHVVRPGDVAQVLDRALDALIAELEKRKFGNTNVARATRVSQHVSENPRHIASHVKRTVAERDLGQCTFVGSNGHRCGERTRIEYDHILPIAKGGAATAENLRLRCRAHNQYEAELVFGEGFMRGKRAFAHKRSAAARDRFTSSPAVRSRLHE